MVIEQNEHWAGSQRIGSGTRPWMCALSSLSTTVLPPDCVTAQVLQNLELVVYYMINIMKYCEFCLVFGSILIIRYLIAIFYFAKAPVYQWAMCFLCLISFQGVLSFSFKMLILIMCKYQTMITAGTKMTQQELQKNVFQLIIIGPDNLISSLSFLSDTSSIF